MSSPSLRPAAAAARMQPLDPRVDLAIAGLAASLLLAVLVGTAAARGAGAAAGAEAGADSVLSSDQMKSLERQLEAPDSTKDGDLWEEYQKYRDRDRSEMETTGERVKVGDSVEVLEDELVQGDVVSIGGDVVVRGSVDGDVVAVGGNVVLYDGAEVSGDAVSVGGRVKEEGSSVVRGEKVSVNVPIPLWGLREHHTSMPKCLTLFLGWKLAFLAVGLLLVLLFNAVAGQRLDVVSRRVEAEPGQSFLIGLLGAFGTPIALLVSFLLLAITLVGLLLFPVLLIVLWLVMLGGFSAVALAVGRRLSQRAEPGMLQPAAGSYRNLTVGFLVLHGILVLGMILSATISWGPGRTLGVLLGVLGVFVVVFATIMGYGGALLSRLGTRTPGPATWAPAGGGPSFPGSMPPPPPGHAPPMTPPGGGPPPPPPPPPPPGPPSGGV